MVEACRDERRLNVIETFVADLRYAGRQLRHAPSFTAVAVLSLALGIGANTAIFSAIDALMLRPLPVRSPEQLVSLRTWFAPTGPGTWAPFLPSYTAFQAMREGTNVFLDMGAVYRESRIIDGEVLRIGVVSATYFTTLGVTAIEGRTFLPEEDQRSWQPSRCRS